MGDTGLNTELHETGASGLLEILSNLFGRGALFVAAALVSGSVFLGAAQAAHQHKDEAGRFLTELIAECNANLAGDAPNTDRQAWLAKLVFSGFDVEAVSQFVMGDHWASASESERREFRTTFADYLLLSFGSHLQRIPRLKIKIMAARHLGENATVVRSNLLYGETGATLYIDWRLRQVGREWRIADMVIQGISFVSVLRSEFVSVLDTNGGEVKSLLAVLKRKNAKLYAAAD